MKEREEAEKELMKSVMENIFPGFRKWFHRANPDQQTEAITKFMRGYNEGLKIRRRIETKEVFMLEVNVKEQNPHFQAVFISESLANKAKDKYLNDPACKKEFMETNIQSYEVHTDLTILDTIIKR